MGDVTKIEWCHHTFNPWIGCSKVHTGCKHCYAEADMDTRRGMAEWGDSGNRVRTADTSWAAPLKWDRDAKKAGERRRVFCASLADVFEDFDGPVARRLWNGAEQRFEFTLLTELRRPHDRSTVTSPHGFTLTDLRRDLFRLIDATPWLDWMLLTKRPENIPRMWGYDWHVGRRKNVWLGTSVSDQATADRMIPALLDCRHISPVLFVSAEPLIDSIDFSAWMHGALPCGDCEDGLYVCTGEECFECNGLGEITPDTCIDLVIVGGESGANARPCLVESIRKIVEQCAESQTACFVKQIGSQPYSIDERYGTRGIIGEMPVSSLHVSDRKGGDPSEWPASLRVRQFPANQNGV